MDFTQTQAYLDKWAELLRLRDWDIALQFVDKPWRKTGDIKIDRDNRNAVVLINRCDPKQTNLEQVVVHELLHLKLWGLDQMIEDCLSIIFGQDDADPKREYAMTQFFLELEPTVNDLAKSFMQLGGDDSTPSLGRLNREIRDEIGE